MDLLQLKYFTTLAKYMHYTKAAEALYISQPALSNAIKRLEADLDAPLFIRRKDGLQLSEYGAMILPVAQNVLEELDSVQRRISDVKKHRNTAIRIIAPSGFVYSSLMDKLLQTDHNISFIVGNISPAEVNRTLKSGSAHFCIYGHDISTTTFPREYLGNKPNYLTVYKTHPLADRKKISFKEIENVDIIALYRGTSPRREFEDQCKNAGIKPTIKVECSDIYQAMYHEKMLAGEVALFGPLRPIRSRIGSLDDYRFIEIDGPKFRRVLYWNTEHVLDLELFNEVKNIIVNFYKNEEAQDVPTGPKK